MILIDTLSVEWLAKLRCGIDGMPLRLGRIIVEVEVVACNENHGVLWFSSHIGHEAAIRRKLCHARKYRRGKSVKKLRRSWRN